jgi:signal transduction histidine kinase
MGLGLAISKKILLDHGGDLELAATSPAGTTFRLFLPHLEKQQGPAAATTPSDPGDTA